MGLHTRNMQFAKLCEMSALWLDNNDWSNIDMTEIEQQIVKSSKIHTSDKQQEIVYTLTYAIIKIFKTDRKI